MIIQRAQKTKSLNIGEMPYTESIAKQDSVEVDLNLISFIEEELYYVYSPEMDLYGYGQTDVQARESFDFILRETLQKLTKEGVLFDELKKLGWFIKQSRKTVELVVPLFSDLVNVNSELKEIVDTKIYTRYLYAVNIPMS
jgi:hypothetical protein